MTTATIVCPDANGNAILPGATVYRIRRTKLGDPDRFAISRALLSDYRVTGIFTDGTFAPSVTTPARDRIKGSECYVELRDAFIAYKQITESWDKK